MKSIFNILKDLAGVSFIDAFHKSITYGDFLLSTCPPYQHFRIKRIRQKQQRIVSALKKKNKYKVLFFMQNDTIWKYDALYRLFERSDIFEPIVAVSPYNVHLVYDKQECLNVLKRTELYAQSQGYKTISTYDEQKHRFVDIKKIVQPDIVFFTKPYKDTLPEYHIYHFSNSLTLYAPYGICCIDIYRINYNLPFNNLLWRFLVETGYQRNFARKYSLCKGDNAVVVGALGSENLMHKDYLPQDVWKPQDKPKKRIIWAPHHTVDYLFNFSNFLVYADDMLRLADKYKDTIQWAFKPHPVLKFKLINLWGKERTKEYYQKWNQLDNAQLTEGDYTDLFLTSDALIHDCASFTAEYLYTRKPVLFMVRDPQVEKHWNIFGKQCFDKHYHAESLEQTEQFIQDVVLGGNDRMKQDRELFYQSVLCPKDGKMPSENIYNLLINALQQSF